AGPTLISWVRVWMSQFQPNISGFRSLAGGTAGKARPGIAGMADGRTERCARNGLVLWQDSRMLTEKPGFASALGAIRKVPALGDASLEIGSECSCTPRTLRFLTDCLSGAPSLASPSLDDCSYRTWLRCGTGRSAEAP